MWQLGAKEILYLLPIPVLFFFYFVFFKKARAYPNRTLAFCDPLKVFRSEIKRTQFWIRLCFVLSLVAFGLLIFAISRPMQIFHLTKKWSEGVDIVIVFDVSESMEADDLKPTRFIAAKDVITRFVRSRPNDRMGLVIFGGESITKSPLTQDHEFLISMVEDIRFRELKQGTAIGQGLSNGVSRLRHSDSKAKIIVLLTDGDSNVGAINPITAANLARQEGIKVYTIGIGSSNRVVVPIYSYDIYGKRGPLMAQVPSYLNPELLAKVSFLTGGKAYMARDTGMLQRILQEIDNLERTRVKMSPEQKRVEYFWIPAGVAVAILFGIYLFFLLRYPRVLYVSV